MRPISLGKFIPPAAFLLYLIFFFSTIQNVPFHPDEATQIYMSHDVDLLLTTPSRLLYHPEVSLSAEQRYHLIDAPLPRTIIGISRNIFQMEPLASDWNWSLGWEENKTIGAFPSNTILLIARISLGLFVPIGLIFFYLTLKSMLPWSISLMASLFLGFNAIFLLHTRRAMSEGISFSLYFITLFLLFKYPRNAVVLGIFSGLTLVTKQTVIPILLLPVVYWIIDSLVKRKFVSLLKNIIIYFALILLIYYLFNPIVWRDPIHVVALQIQTRLDFSQSQAAEYLAVSSPLAANTFLGSLISWLANTYFAKPAFFDVGNYSANLLTGIKIYQSNALNNLFSGWISGGFLLFCSLFGFIASFRNKLLISIKEIQPYHLYLILSILQTGFVLFFLPITFQRYYLLNLSLAVIWAAIGIHILGKKFLFKAK